MIARVGSPNVALRPATGDESVIKHASFVLILQNAPRVGRVFYVEMSVHRGCYDEVEFAETHYLFSI